MSGTVANGVEAMSDEDFQMLNRFFPGAPSMELAAPWPDRALMVEMMGLRVVEDPFVEFHGCRVIWEIGTVFVHSFQDFSRRLGWARRPLKSAPPSAEPAVAIPEES